MTDNNNDMPAANGMHDQEQDIEHLNDDNTMGGQRNFKPGDRSKEPNSSTDEKAPRSRNLDHGTSYNEARNKED